MTYIDPTFDALGFPPRPAHMVLHDSYKLALYPVALAAIEEGRIKSRDAWCIANYAATDLLLFGRTSWFPMEAVAEVLPEFAPKPRERKAA